MPSLFEIQKNLGFCNPLPEYPGEEQFSLTVLKQSQAWPLITSLLHGLEVAPQPGDYRAFAQTYSTVVWVYVAAWIISTSISTAPFRLYEKLKGEDKILKDGILFNLFDEPNPYESGPDLIEKTALFLELNGDDYWEKFGSVKGLPLELYNLEPYYVKIAPDTTKRIKHYEYSVNDAFKKKFFPQQICHFKYSNPTDPLYGQGTVKALATSLVTELYRESYNKTFFENEARPDLIIKHNPDINKGIPPLQEISKRKFAAAWSKAFGGPRKSRLPVLMESGMDVEVLSEARRDMDFREMEKSLRERIFGAFGVPPAMAGIYEYANYANAKEQIRIFWTTTLPPKCRKIERTIQKNIIIPYNKVTKKEYYCRFDMDIIPALEETVKEREERLSRMLERGGITIGDYATALGYPMTGEDKKTFGDKRVLAANLVSLDDAFTELPEEQEPPEGGFQPPQSGKFPAGASPSFQPEKKSISLVDKESNDIHIKVDFPEINITNPAPIINVKQETPIVNVNVPEKDIIVEVPKSIINIQPPAVNVEAPVVNVRPPNVTVKVPVVKKTKKVPVRNDAGLITEIKEVDED